MAEDVFSEIAQKVPKLKDINYDTIGESGLQLRQAPVSAGRG
jgi:hypothetical protein